MDDHTGKHRVYLSDQLYGHAQSKKKLAKGIEDAKRKRTNGTTVITVAINRTLMEQNWPRLQCSSKNSTKTNRSLLYIVTSLFCSVTS